MRITGGELRGRKLPPMRGNATRPTSERVREALFSILGQDLTGCRVLDVFSGSGALAFEALSRGAASVHAFERDVSAVRHCRGVSRDLGVEHRFVIRKGTVPGCLPATGAYDIVFVDPPYDIPAGSILSRLAPLLAGVLVLEHQLDPGSVEGLRQVDTRSYGATRLTFYRGTDDALIP